MPHPPPPRLGSKFPQGEEQGGYYEKAWGKRFQIPYLSPVTVEHSVSDGPISLGTCVCVCVCVVARRLLYKPGEAGLLSDVVVMVLL